jgi:CBS domain containing-hemolysin-like protein
MVATITSILLFILMVCAVALARVYSRIPLKEIKRRANRGNVDARGLYHVVRHGRTAIIILQAFAVLAFSSLTVIIGQSLTPLFAVLLITLLVSSIFISDRLPRKPSERIAGLFAPHYARLLVRIRPATNIAARIFRRFASATGTSHVYEVEDLIELIEQQKENRNNRIEKNQLDLALHALSFGQKIVKDHMVPRKVVHFVRAEEPVGPILMNELHDSGFSRFPVRKDKEDEVVGTLYLKDLVEKRVQGIVSNVMSPDVFDVRETDTLEKVLAMFLKTKHHLFIVRNEFSELVGIITIEDVLEQILGRKIVDESDVHEDMREVAAEEEAEVTEAPA